MSVNADAYYALAKGGLPRALFSDDSEVHEVLRAYSLLFGDQVHDLIDTLKQLTYIDTSTGIWLDLHAKDRGTSRQNGESDAQLRERIRRTEQAVTRPNIEDRLNAFLDVSGVVGTVVFEEIPLDGAYALDNPGTPADADGYAFTHSTSTTTSWAGRAMTSPPSGFIVIVPSTTPDATVLAMKALLLLIKAAGFVTFIEKAV